MNNATINYTYGNQEFSTSYPNGVYYEMFYIKSGTNYTGALSSTTAGQAAEIRWRSFNASTGAFVGSISSDETYKPSTDSNIAFWYHLGNSNSSTTVTFSGGADAFKTADWKMTGNLTLTANWSANTYYVAYNGNGHTSGSMSNSTHTYGVAKNLTANAYAKTGYTFAGWNTATNGSGTSYSNQQSVTNLTSTSGGTVTLYAQWTANKYYVAYNGNGSTSGSMSNSEHTYGVAKNLTANAYAKTGYTFAGWNTAANGSGTGYTNQQSVINLTSTSGATVTLYAKWTVNTYYVA